MSQENDHYFREDKDLYFLGKAQYISTASKDPSTKVGAVIVDISYDSVSDGYNGFPRLIEDKPELYNNREEKYKRVLHAEQNAVLGAAMSLRKPYRIYTWPLFPCHRCALEIIQLGIKEVISVKTPEMEGRWDESHELAKQLFDEAGVRYKIYDSMPV